MSLQATEATLVDMDKEGNILKEENITIELVQRGDILRVRHSVSSHSGGCHICVSLSSETFNVLHFVCRLNHVSICHDCHLVCCL